MLVRYISRFVALAGLLTFVLPAQADSLFGDFTIRDGSPSASGGQVTFNLNGDGTIAASLTSFEGGIIGFGFDSVSYNLPESNFSVAPSNAAGWSDMYGNHPSGFYLCDGCTNSVTWTIGNPGDFSSVFDAITGSGSSYDFFLYAYDSTNSSGPIQWAAQGSVAAVPEPETYAMLLAGLSLLGFAARRRKLREATA